MTPIRGKVARILNTRELVINLGSEGGVTPGMYFDVMDPKGTDIEDPDTGDILGSIERPKVRVKVSRVETRLSIVSTYKSRQVNIGGQGNLNSGFLSQFLEPPKWVTKYETLKTQEKTWEDLDEKESYVKIGDPVVQVIDAADDDTDVSGDERAGKEEVPPAGRDRD